MICRDCGKEMTDLTHGKGEYRNYYCGNWGYPEEYGLQKQCKTHHWKGKWYTEDEWEKYVNEE